MNIDFQDLKAALPAIPDVLELKKESSNSLCGPCPKCGGEDRFVYKTDTRRFFCRGCHIDQGDVLEFHQYYTGKTIPKLADEYLSPNGAPPLQRIYTPPPQKKKAEKSQAPGQWNKIPTVDDGSIEAISKLLVTARKVGPKTVLKAIKRGVLKRATYCNKDCVVALYKTLEGAPHALQYLSISQTTFPKDGVPEKNWTNKPFRKGSRHDDGFFMAGASLQKTCSVVLVESIVNALSVADVAPDVCCMAIGSTSYAKKTQLLNTLKGKDIACFFDNDPAADKAIQSVATQVNAEISMVIWPEGTPTGYDVNDLLKDGRGADIERMLYDVKLVKREIGRSTGDKCLTDADRPRRDVVDLFNKHHADIMLNGQRRIMNHDLDTSTGQPSLSFSIPNDFLGHYKGDTETVMTKNRKGIVAPTIMDQARIWIEDQRRQKYEGIAFDPSKGPVISFPQAPSKKIYNMWAGFVVKPKPGDWSLFRKHIEENIASKNLDVSEYILSWIARIVQTPGGKRPGVSIVMKGKQGTGKSFFVERISELLPTQHYTKVSQSAHVTGRFNAHLQSTLLLFVDEGTWGGNKDAEGAIKDMITSSTQQIEGKGKNMVSVQSHLNIIIASNNDWVIPAGLEERRFFTIEVADFPVSLNKGKYFKAIADQMDNGGLEAMMHDLLNRDISNVNLRDFPRTDALFDQIYNTMTTVQKYWFDVLNRASLSKWKEGKWDFISNNDQYVEFLEYATAAGDRYPGTAVQFSKALNRMCPGIITKRPREDKDRVRVRIFPEISICRKHFEGLIKMDIKWETML